MPWDSCGLITMAADRKCCVPDCDKTREDNILHKFPNPLKDLGRFRTWTFAIGGNILVLDDMYVYNYRRVCHSHFEDRYWTRSKMLTKNAVPTLLLKGFVIRKPLVDISNKQCPAEINVETATASTSTSDSSSAPGDLLAANKLKVLKSAQIDLKPTCLKNTSVQQQINCLQRKIQKLTATKAKYAVKIKKAIKLSENKMFQNTLKKFTSLAAIFTAMQFREIGKNKMGRRFTEEEKIMALSVYKMGPRCYRFLNKIFVLPSPVTLSRMVSRAALKPGLNENLFKQLKKRAQKMKPDDRLCCLLFDEMALSPHFEYNKKCDRILGFVDNGVSMQSRIADHALVLMIRGIFKNYKQPVCFTFCSGSTKKDELYSIIKNSVRKLHSVGFTVLATVCDQGTSNVSAINQFIEETRSEYLKNGKEKRHKTFEIDGIEVIPLFDVPHLLKGIRNNLINKDLIYKVEGEKKIAKWDHIIKLYENIPTYKGIKLIKKITEYHCIPLKIPKMKVKYASQIFSQTVGVNMGYLADKGLLPGECKDTADIIIFFDELFDSLNGSYTNSTKRSGKPLLQALTPVSLHNQIWTKAKHLLKTMNFVSKNGKVCVVPSINNWVQTIENMECLRNRLFNVYNIKSIWCRHFNQDPLENFFGSIRSHGYRNNSPTCAGFEAAFASLLVNNLSSSYSPGSNCEEDSCFNFKSLSKLFFTKSKAIDMPSEVDFNHIYNNDFIVDIEIKKRDLRIIAALQYVTGYILRKCHNKVFKNCEICNNNMYDANKATEYIKVREFNKNKGYLTYPSEELVNTFSIIQDIVYNVLQTKSNTNNIRNYINLVLEIRVDTNFLKCEVHKKELVAQIFNISCMIFICNWCRNINKILLGLVKDYDKNDLMQLLAANYFNKRRKK